MLLRSRLLASFALCSFFSEAVLAFGNGPAVEALLWASSWAADRESVYCPSPGSLKPANPPTGYSCPVGWVWVKDVDGCCPSSSLVECDECTCPPNYDWVQDLQFCKYNSGPRGYSRTLGKRGDDSSKYGETEGGSGTSGGSQNSGHSGSGSGHSGDDGSYGNNKGWSSETGNDSGNSHGHNQHSDDNYNSGKGSTSYHESSEKHTTSNGWKSEGKPTSSGYKTGPATSAYHSSSTHKTTKTTYSTATKSSKTSKQGYSTHPAAETTYHETTSSHQKSTKTGSATSSHPTTHSPKPSKAYGKKRQSRNVYQTALTPCPAGESVCPLPGLRLSAGLAYECVEPQNDLLNCGGCSVTGEGQNCIDIPEVKLVECYRGSCIVGACSRGNTPSLDRKTCVRTTGRW